jgi:hypothetical protein
VKFRILQALSSNSGQPTPLAPLPYSQIHQSPLPWLTLLTLGTRR